MRRGMIYMATLVLALCATGCMNDPFGENEPTSQEVKLWAGITRDQASRAEGVAPLEYTRTVENTNPGLRNPGFDGTLDIGIVRMSKKEDADRYPDFRAMGEPVLAQLGAVDGGSGNIRPIEFLSQAQFFPDASSQLRYAAWYPWKNSDDDPYVDDEGSVYYSDELATYVTSEITGSKDVMYGNVIEGSLESGFPVMRFDHALCVFRIHVYAMIAYDEHGQEVSIADWGKLEEVTLMNVPQQVKMVLPHLCTEVVDGKSVHNGESSDYFTLEYMGETSLELHNDPNIPFAPPEHFPLGITKREMVSEVIAGPPASGVLKIGVKTSTQKATQEVSIARNFQAGHAYDIVLRFSDHGMINAEAVVGEWGTNPPLDEELAANIYYDLSTNETSNCYVIRSANYSYCFDCSVKGNGNGELLGMSEADTRLNVSWVDVLSNDLPTNIDLDGDGDSDDIFTLKTNIPSENRVLFNINGYETKNSDGTPNFDNKQLPARGNVIIGGYDKNPAEGGKLLWTWHLWITPQPTPVGCSNGFVVLDRNLGAIASEPTTGGVNDPAHGLLYQWGRPTPLRAEGLTATTTKYMLEDPFSAGVNVIYGKGDPEGAWIDSSSKWFAQSHDHMWGDSGKKDEDHKKTLYDPCPAGYFVANYAFWRDYEEYEVSFENKGVLSNRDSENIWLPSTTVYNDSAVADNSFVGVTLRTSSVDTEDGNSPYNFYYTASRTAQRSSVNSQCNYAIPVRCIATTTAPSVVNLSESQTANCYVVTEPGYYKFKATVRGNGVTELWPFGNATNKQMLEFGDDMDATINPSRIDLLWWQGDFTEMSGVSDADMIKTLQCIEIQNDGKLKDGFAEFQIREGNFHPGNAVIAAYDGAGNILWTWHIWMPSERPKDIRSGRKTVQDRNLGATQAPVIGATGTSFNFVDYKGDTATGNEAVWSTFGFFYQWGRKDPIMGAPVGTQSSTAVDNLACAPYWVNDGTETWSKRTTIPRVLGAGAVRISWTVQNPLTFVYTSNANDNENSLWFPSFTSNLSTGSALWGYAVQGTGAGEDFSKTFYDPCPPGYRTAFHTVWKNGANGQGGYGGDDSGTETYAWTNEGNFTNYGFVTTKATYGFDRTFYPYAGRRLNTGALQNVSTIGYMTSGMPMGNFNTRTYRYGSRTTNNSQQVTNEGRSYGRSVRCMKE